MLIRTFKTKEIDRLVEIWLQASILAHDFIDIKYWESMQIEMKEKYLPKSNNYVLDLGGGPVGFVSMVDSYLAALFIDVNHQKKGYGRKLLEFIQEEREKIELKVYRRNVIAVNFYLKSGFKIIQELTDENTSQNEYLMSWMK